MSGLEVTTPGAIVLVGAEPQLLRVVGTQRQGEFVYVIVRACDRNGYIRPGSLQQAFVSDLLRLADEQ